MRRLARFALLLALAACGRKEEAAAPAPPPGTIKELESEASITTEVNARAPAFARTAFDGGLIRTQDVIGRKVLLLDFWSVFCQSCLREMSFLRSLQERYGPEGLQVVGVNTDFFPRERIEKFMEKTRLQFPWQLIHDRDQSLSRLFSVEALPVLVLIDSAGWIRMVHLGYRPEDESAIESRVRSACGRIKETVVTLQPVGGTTAFAPPEKGRTVLGPGTAVADFRAIGTDGSEFSFASWRGRDPAVVFFWSIFCQPCRKEFGHLSRLAERSGAGLKVLAVNVDSPKLRPTAVRLLEAQGEALTGVFDPELEGGRLAVSGQFGVEATPSTFLIGGDGSVRASWSGGVSEEALAAAIAALHAASAARAGDAR